MLPANLAQMREISQILEQMREMSQQEQICEILDPQKSIHLCLLSERMTVSTWAAVYG